MGKNRDIFLTLGKKQQIQDDNRVCTQFVITGQTQQPQRMTKYRQEGRRIKAFDQGATFIFVQLFSSREGRNTLTFLSSHPFVKMNSNFTWMLHSLPCRDQSGLKGKNFGVNQFKITPPLCTRKTLQQINDFSLGWKSLVKDYGLNLMGKKTRAVINGAPGRATLAQEQLAETQRVSSVDLAVDYLVMPLSLSYVIWGNMPRS